MERITEFVRAQVAPVLVAEGIAGRGLSFSRTAINGDVALIQFEGRRFDPAQVTFGVSCGVLPATWLAWLFGDQEPPKRVFTGYCLWQQALRAEQVSVIQPGVVLGTVEYWQFPKGTLGDACAADLLPKLAAVIPTMLNLLDRRFFARAIETRAFAPQQIKAGYEHALAALYCGSDERENFDEVLHWLTIVSPGAAAWFRAYDSSLREA